MANTRYIALFLVALCMMSLPVTAELHPAELNIINSSIRKLTVKIMKAGDDGKAGKFSQAVIDKTHTVKLYFSETGKYYLKTLAECKGKPPLYTKGDPFEVYVGSDGYSVLTITISIDEAAANDPLSQVPISREEYDKDSDK